VINGLIDLIEEDTGGVVSYVMAQQPVASPTVIEQRKPYHEHAFGRSSGLVKNGGAWNAALAVEEGPIRRAGAILLVQRPLPNEAIRRVTVQLQGLQTALDCDILLQDRHVESTSMSLIQCPSWRALHTNLVARVLARMTVHRLGARLYMDTPLSHRSHQNNALLPSPRWAMVEASNMARTSLSSLAGNADNL
jgi:hypothetical protein